MVKRGNIAACTDYQLGKLSSHLSKSGKAVQLLRKNKKKILQSRQLKTINMKTTNTYRTQRYTPYSHENQSKQRLIKRLEQEVEKWKTEAEQSKSEMKVWEEAFHLQVQQTEKARSDYQQLISKQAQPEVESRQTHRQYQKQVEQYHAEKVQLEKELQQISSTLHVYQKTAEHFRDKAEKAERTLDQISDDYKNLNNTVQQLQCEMRQIQEKLVPPQTWSEQLATWWEHFRF